jgi:hypothetical protein
VLQRCSRLLVAIALVFAVGGHWAVLQSVAWVSMVAAYSQSATVTEAITKTFSGKAPCELCKVVAAGKKSQQEQEQQKFVVKLDWSAESHPLVLLAPPFEPVLSPGSAHAPARCDSPPLRPPIAA